MNKFVRVSPGISNTAEHGLSILAVTPLEGNSSSYSAAHDRGGKVCVVFVCTTQHIRYKIRDPLGSSGGMKVLFRIG